MKLSVIAIAARRAIGGRMTHLPSPAAREAAAGPPAAVLAGSERLARKPRQNAAPMSDAERAAYLYRRGTPLSELRADYGQLATDVVRAACPHLGWRRAA
ncbi:hypothetical protein [Paraburkholderia mimosarum]|uniref:hypothetical protein n=1 Tax=Paraburkholderia mimosarum TaxID=312026 RepID=UPI0012DC7900|nr:hypothetical protein [Paraburkholderia mimosarum]